MRRAKFVLNQQTLHQALGLGPSLSVVGVHVTHDPDLVYALVEGPGVPRFAGAAAELAGEGLAEAPIMQWPQPAESSPADATPAESRGRVAVNVCGVDETVGAGDESAVLPEVEVLTAVWDAVRAAVSCGVSEARVHGVFKDALTFEGSVKQRVTDVVAQIRRAEAAAAQTWTHADTAMAPAEPMPRERTVEQLLDEVSAAAQAAVFGGANPSVVTGRVSSASWEAVQTRRANERRSRIADVLQKYGVPAAVVDDLERLQAESGDGR